MSAEQAKAEVGELKRLFRDMLVTITWGLDGKRTSADCVAHLKLVARNSKLYQFNSAPAQPMRELIRSPTCGACRNMIQEPEPIWGLTGVLVGLVLLILFMGWPV